MNTKLSRILKGRPEDYLVLDPNYFLHRTAQDNPTLKRMKRIDFTNYKQEFDPTQEMLNAAKKEFYSRKSA